MILSDFSILLEEILQNPTKSAIIIANLILIESLLSIDNAAVLATMVMDLPEKQRKKALKYGIWGAYLFRGLALIFASVLISVWWVKPWVVYISSILLWTGLLKRIKIQMEKKNRKSSTLKNPDGSIETP